MCGAAAPPSHHDGQHEDAVDRENRALGHDVGESAGFACQRHQRAQTGQEEHCASPEHQLGRRRDSDDSDRQEQSVEKPHRQVVRIAGRDVAVAAIGFDAAARGSGKAPVKLHHRGDQRRIDRAEEHAGRRCRYRIVYATERPVAEHAITIEIVSQRHIKRLVEILQVPRRLRYNQCAQDDERQDEETNSCRKSC